MMATVLLTLAIASLVSAAIPALMFIANMPLFTWSDAEVSDDRDDAHAGAISVLIPARDEAGGIENSVTAALASDHVDVEVVVLDDHSTDETASIVRAMGQADGRVRYLAGRELPDGWNGKQHACWQLADAASHDRMVFLDADVRLAPTALARLIRRQDRTGVALLSAFPHQETGTWLEKWIIPMMHFILLGFLPFGRMRMHNDESLAAGCGQLFMTSKANYRRAGTHRAIQASRHDGVKLPRAYRQADLSTDVMDGSDLAQCRMYVGAAQVIRGVLKNAIEGIAAPRLIVPFTVMLVGGSVLPLVILAVSIATGATAAMWVSVAGVLLGHFPRAYAAVKFRQSILGVLCHAPATATFIVLQWIALANHLLGRQVAWRGRVEKV